MKMDKKIFIIHGSAIVQNGIANILRKNFKCEIYCFVDFEKFTQSDDYPNSEAIIFIEDVIASSDEYLQFSKMSDEVKSFKIVTCNTEKSASDSQYTLYLYNSAEEIYELVKSEWRDEPFVEEDSEGLSNREIDVLKFVAHGYTNKEIADKLFISIHTVMSHRKNITEKLGIKSISGLTVYAIINNYIDTSNLEIKDLL